MGNLSSNRKQRRAAKAQQRHSDRQPQWWDFAHLSRADVETAIYAMTSISVIAGSGPRHCSCCSTSAIWRVDELQIEASWMNSGGVNVHHHWEGDSRSEQAENVLSELVAFLNSWGSTQRRPETANTIH
jgi:hypothetical protein